MIISLENFIKIYRKIEFNTDSVMGTYNIKTSEDIELLSALSLTDNEINTGLRIVGEYNNLKIGDIVTLSQDSVPEPRFCRIYDDFNKFVKADIGNLKVTEIPFYIKSDDFASCDENKINIFINYQAIKKLLKHLIDMDSYTDNVTKKLIFFSKKTFELSIEYQDDFIKEVRELNSYKKNIIESFCNWIDDEKTSQHIGEIKSILAFVLSESLSPDATLIDVVRNIKNINESVRGQYALYLENFSYEKFVKKLSENTEKFVSNINDTISKVLPQFLGLPFLTTIPSVLGGANTCLVYLGVVAYCIMCILGLSNQKLVLDYIKNDVKNFGRNGSIPDALKSDWENNKKRINKLVSKQKKLYCFLMFSVWICLLYGLYKILFLII